MKPAYRRYFGLGRQLSIVGAENVAYESDYSSIFRFRFRPGRRLECVGSSSKRFAPFQIRLDHCLAVLCVAIFSSVGIKQTWTRSFTKV